MDLYLCCRIMNKVKIIKQRQVLIVGVYLFLLLGISSCVSRERRQLDSIELMLESNPAKADSILSVMSIPNGKKERAWYAVLKTQAEYKNYKPIISDSLILMATDFYGTPYKSFYRQRKYRAAMAWYSQGCMYYQENNNKPAIDAFLKAKDLFPDTLNRYYLYSEQNLGKCYLNRMMIEEALGQFNLCADELLNQELTTAYCFVFYNIGLANLYSKNFIRSDSIFRCILQEPFFSYEQKVGALLNEAKIQFYGYDNSLKALEYLNEHIKLCKDKDRPSGYNLKGNIYDTKCQYDSAYYYYRKSYDNTDELYTRCSNAEKMVSLALKIGYSDEALRWHEEYILLRDSVARIERSNDIEELLRMHQDELNHTELSLNKKRHLLIVAGLVLVFALILCVIYFAEKWKKEKTLNTIESKIRFELQKTTLKIYELLSKTNVDDSPEIQRSLLINLYRKRIDLCKQLYQLSAEFSLMVKIVHNLDDNTVKQEKVSAIVNAVKHAFVECIYDIHREADNIKDSEVVVMLFSALGCNNSEMGRLLFVSSDAVRKRKKKLMDAGKTDFLSLYIPSL